MSGGTGHVIRAVLMMILIKNGDGSGFSFVLMRDV